MARMSTELVTDTTKDDEAVARLSDVPEGTFRIFEVRGIEIGLTQHAGVVHAIRNVCPHQGAPVCKGRVRGTWDAPRPGELTYSDVQSFAVCPWHGFEFNLESGKAEFGATRGKLRVYPTDVRDGVVFVTMTRESRD